MQKSVIVGPHVGPILLNLKRYVWRTGTQKAKVGKKSVTLANVFLASRIVESHVKGSVAAAGSHIWRFKLLLDQSDSEKLNKPALDAAIEP